MTQTTSHATMPYDATSHIPSSPQHPPSAHSWPHTRILSLYMLSIVCASACVSYIKCSRPRPEATPPRVCHIVDEGYPSGQPMSEQTRQLRPVP